MPDAGEKSGLAEKRPAHQTCRGPAESKYRTPSVRRGLERQLQSELDEARVVYGGIDRPKTASVDVAEWLTELSVVEEVEEFRPEIQTHIFPRQLELFDHREIGIDEIWTVDGNTTGVPEFTLCRVHKACRVNVLGLGLVCVGAATSNLVGAVEVVAIAAS